jgi:hypothetical protein
MNKVEEIAAAVWWIIAFVGCVYLLYTRWDVPLTKEQINAAVVMLLL